MALWQYTLSFVRLPVYYYDTLNTSATAYLGQNRLSRIKSLASWPIPIKSTFWTTRYLEPRYLELFAISNEIVDPVSNFCPISRTFAMFNIFMSCFYRVFILVYTCCLYLFIPVIYTCFRLSYSHVSLLFLTELICLKT